MSSSEERGEIRIRRATVADAPRTAEVWRSAWWDGHRGRVPPELVSHRTDDYFRHQATAWVTRTTVAVDEADSILGVVIVDRDELVQLAVGAGSRRLGVGAALLAAAEEQIGAEHEHAWLAVVPQNEQARRFYERRGWHDAGPYQHVAPGGREGITVPTRRYVKRVR